MMTKPSERPLLLAVLLAVLTSLAVYFAAFYAFHPSARGKLKRGFESAFLRRRYVSKVEEIEGVVRELSEFIGIDYEDLLTFLKVFRTATDYSSVRWRIGGMEVELSKSSYFGLTLRVTRSEGAVKTIKEYDLGYLKPKKASP